MSPDGNTVNISRRYHHGQLRAQLILAGMDLLERENAEELSLRAVARESGVSPTAVYRHFADKAALLRGIAEQGFALMAGMQAEAGRGLAGEAAFAASGIAYVRFALAHPAVFRLMFSAAPAMDLFNLPPEQLSPPFRLLREQVAGVMGEGTPEPARKVAAIRAWSLVHGLAVLALSGMVRVDEEAIIQVIAGAACP